MHESTVRRQLIGLGYSLQANRKTHEGADHPDRDGQFERIAAVSAQALASKEPLISVDTKKKELIGNYKNAGRELAPTGRPILVNTHDFPDSQQGKAIPYGIYDVGRVRDGSASGRCLHTAPPVRLIWVLKWPEFATCWRSSCLMSGPNGTVRRPAAPRRAWSWPWRIQ